MIERDAADLDLATNLSDDMHEVFGFTQFERGRKPPSQSRGNCGSNVTVTIDCARL